MKKSILTSIAICLSLTIAMAQNAKHEVNLSGNSYVVDGPDGATITDKGLTNWSGEQSKINTYVYFSKPQTVAVTIKGTAVGHSAAM